METSLKTGHQRNDRQVSESPPAHAGEDYTVDTDLKDGLAIAGDWTQTLLRQTKASVELALAETKLAASSFLMMIFLAVVAAVFALTAWGIIVAGTVIGLQALGVPIWAGMLSIGLAHALASLLVFLRIKRLSNNLDMQETRRQIFGEEDSE